MRQQISFSHPLLAVARARRERRGRGKREGLLECMGAVSVKMSEHLFTEAPPLHLQCCRTGSAVAFTSKPWERGEIKAQGL
jgi:hypothetical protein